MFPATKIPKLTFWSQGALIKSTRRTCSDTKRRSDKRWGVLCKNSSWSSERDMVVLWYGFATIVTSHINGFLELSSAKLTFILELCSPTSIEHPMKRCKQWITYYIDPWLKWMKCRFFSSTSFGSFNQSQKPSSLYCHVWLDAFRDSQQHHHPCLQTSYRKKTQKVLSFIYFIQNIFHILILRNVHLWESFTFQIQFRERALSRYETCVLILLYF